MRKWYFSKKKYTKGERHCLNDKQANMLDGEEVEFTPESQFGKTKILGFLVDREWCEKREEKPFKVGDRVRIRQWDDMAREFGTYDNGNIRMAQSWDFIDAMRPLCGKEFIITAIYNEEVEGLGDYFRITTDMLEHVEETAVTATPAGIYYSTVMMMSRLRHSPDKQYKRTDDGLVMSIVDGKYHWESGHRALSPDDRWVEVAKEKEVTFIEAVKAVNKGKSIYCKSLCEMKNIYTGACGVLVDQNGNAISVYEILYGHWFIKEA